MGWNSANRIFDPVAKALIDTGAAHDATRKVLSELISELRDGDWDTCDESLEDFLDDPAIIAAFADHNVHLSDRRCCRAALKDDPRALLLAMRHEDVAEDEMKQAINALARHLAQQIRTDADLRSAEGNRELGIYGRELADLITPKNSRDW